MSQTVNIKTLPENASRQSPRITMAITLSIFFVCLVAFMVYMGGVHIITGSLAILTGIVSGIVWADSLAGDPV